jgi:hypothetical protein
MINSLIQLLIIALVCGVIWWIMDWLPVPEPFNKIVKVVTVVVFLIVVIYILLGISGVRMDVPR